MNQVWDCHLIYRESSQNFSWERLFKIWTLQLMTMSSIKTDNFFIEIPRSFSELKYEKFLPSHNLLPSSFHSKFKPCLWCAWLQYFTFKNYIIVIIRIILHSEMDVLHCEHKVGLLEINSSKVTLYLVLQEKINLIFVSKYFFVPR
jgi:hypothetical protein